jgi:hypothetical protein
MLVVVTGIQCLEIFLENVEGVLVTLFLGNRLLSVLRSQS